MPNRYTLAKDLSDRLAGTICRYDGELVRVNHEKTDLLTLYTFKGEKKQDIQPLDEKLDISMIELGYVNYSGSNGDFVVYCHRDPKKKYKAALDPRYVIFRGVDASDIDFSLQEGFYSKSFEDALLGKYPTFQEGMMMLDSGSHTDVAISMELALKRDKMGLTFLYYKTRAVGWSPPFSSKLNLMGNDLGWVVERYLSRSGLSII